MKNTLLGLTLAAFTATSATAGALNDPIIEQDVVATQAASSSAGDGVGIALVLMMATVLVIATSDNPNLFVSDANLKADITRVGTAAGGLPLYHFRYAGQSQVYEGVMAQDVLQVMPEAVHRLPGGYYAVDYGMLGVAMRKVH